MVRFTKGLLTTLVDEDDSRIPEYYANGWTRCEPTDKQKTAADKRIDDAVREANASEGKNKRARNAASDKKVNDAIVAATNAEAESEAVDDGLIKTEGESNG